MKYSYLYCSHKNDCYLELSEWSGCILKCHMIATIIDIGDFKLVIGQRCRYGIFSQT
jgi:hypothetical protein